MKAKTTLPHPGQSGSCLAVLSTDQASNSLPGMAECVSRPIT